MTPQRDVHWTTIRWIVRALEDRFGMGVLAMSDVRIDFPGKENGFSSVFPTRRHSLAPSGSP
ncbi:hypothetical protein ACGFOU_28755 [Streptomyces sp. NPDC048595]|uniref:hypothetical protein n=1 Tax=Streptomyces sp. NPDC048595 TaxID=3365576 RepID=UPI0037169383